MKHIIYATGYQGKKPQVIKKMADDLDAVVVDIRYSPMSRNPEWRKSNLQALLGSKYVHCQSFGNSAYKTGGIEILNYSAGKAMLETIDAPVILLCACSDAHTCHRTTVLEMLKQDGYTVQEVEISHPKPPILQMLLL